MAAYLDGGLSDQERAAIETHMADCAACREWLSGSYALKRDQGQKGSVGDRRFGRRPVVVAFGSLAAAAAVLLLLFLPGRTQSPRGRRPALEELRAAVGSTRYIEPRVAGEFSYGPMRSPTRGPNDVPPDVQIAASRIQKSLDENRTADALGAHGVARLMLGDAAAAVSALEEATRLAPSDARLWSDLSAAHLSAAAGPAEESAERNARALDAATRATNLNRSLAEAWFNRALALERLPPREDDRQGWQDYLDVESDPAWQAEGRRRQEQAANRPASKAWDEWRSGFEAQISGGGSIARAAVEAFPQATREYLDDELLPRWGAALEGKREEEAGALAALVRDIGQSLTDHTGDLLPRATAAAIDGADADQRRLTALAAGHQAFGAGRRAYDRDRYDDASRAFAEAEAQLGSADSPFRGWATLQVAQVLYQRRDVDRADEGFGRVIAFATAHGYANLAARGLWLRGIVRMQKGELAAALDSYRAALLLLEQTAEHENAAALCNTTADTLRILGERHNGWRYLSRALHRIDDLRNRTRRYVILLNASLYAEQEDLLEASLHFQNASIVAGRARGGAAPEVEGLTRRAALYIRRSDPDTALRDLAAADAALPRIEDAAIRAYLAAGLDGVRGEVLAPREPARAVELLTSAAEFFGRAEPAEVPALLVTRGRAQLAAGDDPAAQADFQRAIDQLEARRELLPGELFRVSYLDKGWDAFSQMIRLQIEQRQSPDAALAYSERARARALVDRQTPADWTAARAIDAFQASLGPADAGLYFVLVPERLLVWVITRDGRRFLDQPVDLTGLDRTLEQLRAALEGVRPEERVRTQAAELYDTLIRPLEPMLVGRTRLVIVPDGSLHAVPFAALFDVRTRRYLVQDRIIVNAPGATVFADASRRLRRLLRTGPPVRALLVGDPSLDSTLFPALQPLPDAAGEAADFARLYPGAAVLQGADATKKRFLEMAPRYSVVHFAGHALANQEYPWFSRLLFAGPLGNEQAASLFAHEISTFDLSNIALVVLAACDTGRGAVYRGEGPINLARPFLAAGVPVVLASLWKVDDRATRELFGQFHKRIRRGDDPAAALAAAQNAMISSGNAALKHPAHWAGFVSIGGISDSTDLGTD